jgi:type II secretory pathway component PulF
MPTFRYTARDGQGRTQQGVLEAESNAVAASLLREQGLWVTGLRSVGGTQQAETPGSPASRLLDPVWSGVSLKELALFFRQFATLIDAGMPLFQSLSTLQAQTTNGRLREVIGQLAAQTERGGRLSEAFRRFPVLFTPLQIAMIEAAEAGGMMDTIMNRLADYLEREYEIRLMIRRKTLYPKLLLLAAIFIPPIGKLFLAGPSEYLRVTVFAILPILLACGAVWVVGRYLLQFAWFRALYDDVKLALPVIGQLVRKLAVGKLTRALAALYGAGLSVPTALSRAAAACGNARFALNLSRVTPMVEQGESLSAAMTATRLFSPMVLGMVQTGEHSGEMEGMLNKIAEYQESEAGHAINQLITVAGVGVFLVVALFVASQIVGFWSNYATGLQQTGQ